MLHLIFCFQELKKLIHFRLIDCLLQYPSSELARDVFGAFFANLTPRGTIQIDDTVVVTLAQCLDLGHIKEDDYDPNTADNDATPGERQSAADRIGHETFDENDGLDVKIKISMDRQRIFALFKCSGVRIVPVPVCILLYLDLNFVLMVPVR